jgi:hypothetical protein
MKDAFHVNLAGKGYRFDAGWQNCGMAGIRGTAFRAAYLFLNICFQPRQGLVPLPGDSIQGIAGFMKGPGLKLEEIFAPAANTSNQARALENAKVFGNRLSRQG